MGYYNGTANDIAAVRSALVNACTLEGWAWNSSTEMLSKGAMFLRLQVVSNDLTLLARTSAASGDAPGVVRMGPIGGNVVQPALTFPVAYEIFVFSDEIFMVINYSIDCYQWCAFGRSTVAGLPGTGMWVGATKGDGSYNGTNGVNIFAATGGTSFQVCPALSWATIGGDDGYTDNNFWLHSNLDSQGWWLTQTLSGSVPVGIAASAPLIGLLPSAWNSEAVLLPIRFYKVRPSSKISLTGDVENARYTRVDNYAPGEIITLGADRWKVYPWYRKNTSGRNGGNGITHSGTFGWAIRYEGP